MAALAPCCPGILQPSREARPGRVLSLPCRHGGGQRHGGRAGRPLQGAGGAGAAVPGGAAVGAPPISAALRRRGAAVHLLHCHQPDGEALCPRPPHYLKCSAPLCPLLGERCSTGSPLSRCFQVELDSACRLCLSAPAVVMVNQSAPAGKLGAVNGARQMVASAVRGAAPALCGFVWAATLNLEVWSCNPSPPNTTNLSVLGMLTSVCHLHWHACIEPLSSRRVPLNAAVLFLFRGPPHAGMATSFGWGRPAHFCAMILRKCAPQNRVIWRVGSRASVSAVCRCGGNAAGHWRCVLGQPRPPLCHVPQVMLCIWTTPSDWDSHIRAA